MSDSLKWLRSQEEAYRAVGGRSTSENFKAAADEIKRLQGILDKLFAGSCAGCNLSSSCEFAWDGYNVGCVGETDCLGAK